MNKFKRILSTLSVLLSFCIMSMLINSCTPDNSSVEEIAPEQTSSELDNANDRIIFKKIDGIVKGKKIPINFFASTLSTSFFAAVDDDDVKGKFSFIEVFFDGSITQDAKGKIICVTFEDDCKTARIAAKITASQTFPEYIGKYAIWTVKDNMGEDNDFLTVVKLGVDFDDAKYHCEVGFSPDDLGGFFFTSGDIKVFVSDCD